MLESLDDPETAGLILEEQANALKSILSDPTVLKLVKVNIRLTPKHIVSRQLWLNDSPLSPNYAI